MNLTAKLLIAMPGMSDTRFARSVVCICTHEDSQGAMGLVINQTAPHITFSSLIKQAQVRHTSEIHEPNRPIHVGGPVENGRGFVLHSTDYGLEGQTMRISDALSMTATIDILSALAAGEGPQDALLALGYSGWSPGQLEDEVLQNAWLTTDADPDLVFHTPDAEKWEGALRSLGIDPLGLSAEAGRA